MKSLLSLLLLLAFLPAQAQPLSEYVERECLGETNVEVAGTIVECLMKNHVVVFDYSIQWAAAMDKAVELSRLTQKKGVVVLIGSHVNADSNARFTAASRALVINEPAAQ